MGRREGDGEAVTKGKFSNFTLPPRFAEQVLDEAMSESQSLMRPFLTTCESPIELTFVAAFRFFSKMMGYRTVRGDDAEPLLPGQTDLGFDFDIWEQFPIDNFRVDFLIGFKDRHVAVECDGRDYHHASREQIDRDRQRDSKLAELGYKVIRFPGTQITNDPFHCAADVLLWLTTGSFLRK